MAPALIAGALFSNALFVLICELFLFSRHTKKVQSKFYLCTLKKNGRK
jgi:hypothetical protein